MYQNNTKKRHTLPRKGIFCCKIPASIMILLFSVLLTFAQIGRQSESGRRFWKAVCVCLLVSRLDGSTKIYLPAQLTNYNLLTKWKQAKPLTSGAVGNFLFHVDLRHWKLLRKNAFNALCGSFWRNYRNSALCSIVQGMVADTRATECSQNVSHPQKCWVQSTSPLSWHAWHLPAFICKHTHPWRIISVVLVQHRSTQPDTWQCLSQHSEEAALGTAHTCGNPAQRDLLSANVLPRLCVAWVPLPW